MFIFRYFASPAPTIFALLAGVPFVNCVVFVSRSLEHPRRASPSSSARRSIRAIMPFSRASYTQQRPVAFLHPPLSLLLHFRALEPTRHTSVTNDVSPTPPNHDVGPPRPHPSRSRNSEAVLLTGCPFLIKAGKTKEGRQKKKAFPPDSWCCCIAWIPSSGEKKKQSGKQASK